MYTRNRRKARSLHWYMSTKHRLSLVFCVELFLIVLIPGFLESKAVPLPEFVNVTKGPLMASNVLPHAIIEFWFAPEHKELWYEKNDDFDSKIRMLFENTYMEAAAGTLDHWKSTANGALSLVIVLDQFPRNMYRNSPKAFAADAKALNIAQYALEHQFDQQLTIEQRHFLYLPFEHSEDLETQEKSVQLFKATGDADALHWAVLHRDIIARFGRFPHRNQVLDRRSTPEEIEFLKGPNSSF